MTKVEGAGHWINKHLITIGAGCLALYTGYLTGTVTAEKEREELKAANARLEARMDGLEADMKVKMQGRHTFMNNAASRVNFLCQENPDCSRTYAALTVPE